MKKLLIFISAMLLLVACGKDDPTPVQKPAKRTVIVYMSAENDLSTPAGLDTTEMIAGSKSLSSDYNYIAYIDMAESDKKPSIWKFEGGKKELLKEYDEDFYSSDPEKMYEILSWIIKKYPAESYGLALWGHGTGWEIQSDTISVAADSNLRRAYGRDTGDNQKHQNENYGKWMNIPTLANVLGHLNVHFDFIFCDCCNMANAETAYELRKLTDYLIASPAEIPGLGAPYDKITPYLFDTSSTTTAYKNLIDTYADEYSSRLPLALVKMSEMEQLANATRVILQTLAPTVDKEFDLSGLMYYDGTKSVSSDGMRQEQLRVLYDMNDFLMQNASADEYTQWKQAFDKAVIYKRFASSWQTSGHVSFYDFTATEEKFGGMSMYIPRTFYDNYSYSKNYNSRYNQMQWYWAVNWDSYGW